MTPAGSGILKNNRFIFAIIAAIMVAVVVLAMVFFSKFYDQDQYYVLNRDVQANTLITPDMVKAVETTRGTAPLAVTQKDGEGNPGVMLTPQELQSGSVYSQIPLRTGEILTVSNTGGFQDIAVGIPDSWVVSSIPVLADDAIGGRIKRGYYFDMMVTDKAQGTFYPFVNLLALDTSKSLNNASSANAADTAEGKTGQTKIYYVGLPPAQAGYLQSVVAQYGREIMLTLSPLANEYMAPDLDAYKTDSGSPFFKYVPGDTELVDSGLGTDQSFSNKKRDKNGRPVDFWPNGQRIDGKQENIGNNRQTKPDSYEAWLKDYQAAKGNSSNAAETE